MEAERKLIFYPIYFDESRSVADGRRISKSMACPCPKISSLSTALGRLGIKFEIENKHHPKDLVGSKRAVVFVSKSKNQVLQEVAIELKKICKVSQSSLPVTKPAKKNRK